MLLRRMLLVWLMAAAFALGEGEYGFIVNGTRRSVEVMSLNGTPDQPQPGDLAQVGGWWITLGEPGDYAFEYRDVHDGSLWRIWPDRAELVAITIGVNNNLTSGPEFSGVMPSKLSRAERQGVHGVKVDGWNARLAKELQLFDLSRVCVEHRFDDLEYYDGGGLPRGLTRLVLDGSWRVAAKSLRFPQLVAASVSSVIDGRELGWLKYSPRLRALSLDFAVADNAVLPPEVPEKLTELRSLETRFGDVTKAAKSLGSHPLLRYLSIDSSAVGNGMRDWTSPSLEELHLSNVKARCLPQGVLPKLRRVVHSGDMIWAFPDEDQNLTKSELDRFRTAHPTAQMMLDWTEQFASWIQGTDRIRLRKGGECCWPKLQRLDFFDSSEPAEVRELLGFLRAQPDAGVSGVMDCGSESLEFYRGDHLLHTLGMWRLFAEGPVSFRFALEPQSARLVQQWVRRRAAGKVGHSDASELRFAKYREIVPDAHLPNVRVTGAEAATVVNAWTIVSDSMQGLASRAYQLYGCHADDWNVSAGLDETLRAQLLPTIPAEVALERATALDTSDDERNGIARWLFADGHHRDLADTDFERLLSGIGREALAHARLINRRMTMMAVAQRNTAATRKLLIEVAMGKLVSARDEKKSHRNALGEAAAFREYPTIPDDVPDAVAAATHLLHHGGKVARRELKSALGDPNQQAAAEVHALLRESDEQR